MTTQNNPSGGSITQLADVMLSPGLMNISDVDFFLSPVVPKGTPSDVIIPPVKVHGNVISNPLMVSVSNPILPPIAINPIPVPIVQPQLVSIIDFDDIFVPFIHFSHPLVQPYLRDKCEIEIVQSKMVKYFRFKFLDKWLFGKSKHILGYLKYSGSDVSLVSDIDHLDDYRKNTQDIVEKKIAYIEDKLLSSDDVYHILKKFVDHTEASWCNLKDDYVFFVREALEKSLEKKIKRMIEKK